MICGHWPKESHKGIHLCQDRGERAGKERIRWTSVEEQRERDLTDRLTTSSILRLFWVCKVKEAPRVCTNYGDCLSISVLLWSLYVEIIYLFFEEVRLMCLHMCAGGVIWTETSRKF